MWVIPSNARFQCKKAHFAMYHAVCTGVLSVIKQMRLHALGRQADARRERTSFCSSCVWFQIHQSDTFLHLCGGGVKCEGKKRPGLSLKKNSLHRERHTGSEKCFSLYQSPLVGYFPHFSSPLSNLLVCSYILSSTWERVTRFFCFSFHSQMAFISSPVGPLLNL